MGGTNCGSEYKKKRKKKGEKWGGRTVGLSKKKNRKKKGKKWGRGDEL